MLCQLQVEQLENYRARQDKGLEDEVAEIALVDMRKDHPEAKRLFCGRSGLLRNMKSSREFDEIIVADNCILVVEVSGCDSGLSTVTCQFCCTEVCTPLLHTSSSHN